MLMLLMLLVMMLVDYFVGDDVVGDDVVGDDVFSGNEDGVVGGGDVFLVMMSVLQMTLRKTPGCIE